MNHSRTEVNRGLLRGAFWLSAAGLVSRLLGVAYRIPLNRLFGPELMGLYQMVYPFYQLLVLMSTSGFPTAIARMVARAEAGGEHNGPRTVLFSALVILSLAGVFLSLVLFLAADIYASAVAGAPAVAPAIRVLSPAVFLVFVITGLRGYFQGRSNLFPYALSQVLEQLTRVCLALLIGLFLLEALPQAVLGGIVAGTPLGACCGLTFLVIYYLRKERPRLPSGSTGRVDWIHFRAVAREMLFFALPVTVGGMMSPLMRVVDVAVVTRRLQLIEGITAAEVHALYGYLTAYAGTVANLPEVFALSLSASLVPAVSRLHLNKEREEISFLLLRSLKLAFVFSLGAAGGLILFSREINLLLFADAGAALTLQVRALGVLFLSLSYVCVGGLHGTGQVRRPLFSLGAGMLVQFLLTFFLTPVPWLNINGAALGRVTGYGTACLLNYYFLTRYTGRLAWRGVTIIKVTFALGVMLLTSYLLLEGLCRLVPQPLFFLLPTILVGAVLYFFLLVQLKVFTREEIEAMPRYGRQVARLLYREKQH